MVDPQIQKESFEYALEDILAQHAKDKKIIYNSYQGDDFTGGKLILRFSDGSTAEVYTAHPVTLNDLLLEWIEEGRLS